MQNLNIPYEAISCKDVNCNNESRRVAINKFYGDIMNAMCNVGDYAFDKYVKVDNRGAQVGVSILMNYIMWQGNIFWLGL